MGLGGQIRKLKKEFDANPNGQYYRNLKKLLRISQGLGIKKEDVVKYVQDWADE